MIWLNKNNPCHQFNIINKMSDNPFQSNSIIHGVVHEIMSNFETKLLAKEVVHKIPKKLQENIEQFTQEIICSSHLPKQSKRKDPLMIEDSMPSHLVKESKLISSIPLLQMPKSGRLDLQSAYRQTREASTPRYLSSSQIRNTRKNVKIDLERVKANKVIELEKRQSTAKSFRSVIQLENRITDLRSTFLKSLRDKQILNKTAKTDVMIEKRKKTPKQFTYDYDFNIIESRGEVQKGQIRSPLKTKSIGVLEIAKKIHNVEAFTDKDCNLQEQLARKSTALPEKEKRVYNNSSKRQLSHFPYISLADNSVLYENNNVLHGTHKLSQTQTCRSWKPKSNFTPFFESPSTVQHLANLFTQAQDVVIPSNIQKNLTKQMNSKNGSILKNPRFFKKSQKRQNPQQISSKDIFSKRNKGINNQVKLKQNAVNQ